MVPWKNSWFQIAFFAWLVSGALLVVDYDYVPGYVLYRAAMHQYTIKNGMPYYADAAPLLQTACDWGSADACDTLAIAYDNGRYGLAQDGQKAAALFEKGCNGGSLDDCNGLADIYFSGLGVDQDAPRAVEFWKKSCKAGGNDGMMACQTLAEIYDPDYREFLPPGGGFSFLDANETPPAGWKPAPAEDGVEKNAESAQVFWTKVRGTDQNACEAGSSNSCFSAGLYYQGGTQGYPKDPQHAATYFQKACDLGNVPGCRLLGNAYEEGNGVAINLGKAKAAYQKGCKLGDTVSGGSCDKLKENKFQ